MENIDNCSSGSIFINAFGDKEISASLVLYTGLIEALIASRSLLSYWSEHQKADQYILDNLDAFPGRTQIERLRYFGSIFTDGLFGKEPETTLTQQQEYIVKGMQRILAEDEEFIRRSYKYY